MNRAARLRGLYVLTPDVLDADELLIRVAAALAGGARIVQYRRKRTDAAARVEEASRIARLCRRAGALLIVNDDARLATEIGADGVHLGRDDGGVAEARAVVGSEAIIGVSCYDQLALAIEAQRQGADYVAFGSFFASSVKPYAVRPPVTLLAEARRTVRCPIVAIGGITLERAPVLVSAGADALAVISDIFDAPDVQARASAYSQLFGQAPDDIDNARNDDHDLTQ